MNADNLDVESIRPVWRVLSEFAGPAQRQVDQWMAAGLAAALDTIYPPFADLDRLKNAVVEAVAQTQRHVAAPGTLEARMVVRVLISARVDARAAPGGWGFFVIEKGTCQVSAVEAADRLRQQAPARCLELYLYADSGPA